MNTARQNLHSTQPARGAFGGLLRRTPTKPQGENSMGAIGQKRASKELTQKQLAEVPLLQCASLAAAYIMVFGEFTGRPQMPIQMLHLFLTVYANGESMPLKELADRVTGSSYTAVSRNVEKLAPYLAKYDDRTDARGTWVEVTKKGKLVMDQINGNAWFLGKGKFRASA